MKSKYWLYVFVWLLILIILSSDFFSYFATRKIIKSLFLFFNPDVHIRTILKFHEFSRKALHIMNYAFLSWLLLCAYAKSFAPIPKWTTKIAILCVLICVCFSVADEWRQSFTSMRTSRLLDICLDTGGAVLTQILCFLIFTFKNKSKNSQTLAQ
jgi:VanZ family protein